MNKIREDADRICENDEGRLREYRLTCERCGHAFSFSAPDQLRPFGLGLSVDCPSCKGLQLTVNTMRISDPEAEHGSLRLNQPTLGGGYIHDFYCLYPELNGETAEERRARLVGYALDACASIDLGTSEKLDLIEQLYDRNPYVLHMAKNILEVIAGEPQQRQVIQEIAPAENGNRVLQRFGVNVIYSTATIQSPSIDISMTTLNGMNAVSEPEPADANEAIRFCPFCGAPAPGVFCPECGTPMK